MQKRIRIVILQSNTTNNNGDQLQQTAPTGQGTTNLLHKESLQQGVAPVQSIVNPWYTASVPRGWQQTGTRLCNEKRQRNTGVASVQLQTLLGAPCSLDSYLQSGDLLLCNNFRPLLHINENRKEIPDNLYSVNMEYCFFTHTLQWIRHQRWYPSQNLASIHNLQSWKRKFRSFVDARF